MVWRAPPTALKRSQQPECSAAQCGDRIHQGRRSWALRRSWHRKLLEPHDGMTDEYCGTPRLCFDRSGRLRFSRAVFRRGAPGLGVRTRAGRRHAKGNDRPSDRSSWIAVRGTGVGCPFRRAVRPGSRRLASGLVRRTDRDSRGPGNLARSPFDGAPTSRARTLARAGRTAVSDGGGDPSPGDATGPWPPRVMAGPRTSPDWCNRARRTRRRSRPAPAR